jgi:probable HAF family extracellular repeat protein
MTDLNSLLPANSGWELTTANAINEQGQIVGSGKKDGQTKAFLLTPVVTTN